MRIRADVAARVQALLGTLAETVAAEQPVIRRRRKFTAATLARTFILGFLADPEADDEALARTAAACGVPVTPQAVGQRFTDRTARFLEALFRAACRQAVASRAALAPLLARFPAVYLMDSTTLALPAALAGRFPGCGGGRGGGQAAMKLQVRWDLKSGALDALAPEPGRDCDYKTPRQHDALPRGSLRIADLGYFDTAVLERLDRRGVYWISRLQFKTSAFTPDGQPLRLLDWLSGQAGPFVDRSVRVGAERRLACRILAWRVPEEVANRRRQRLIAEARSKDGRMPGRERLAWCDWTILITNAPAERLSAAEAAVLYRARWQVELLFKRWKSLGLIAALRGATVARQMVRLWARLLAVLLEHWLVLATAWGDARVSLWKAGTAIREQARSLAASLEDRTELEAALDRLAVVIGATARQNKRKTPSTFELLNDPSQLGYF